MPASVYLAFVFYTGLIRLGKLPEVGFVATDKLLHALVFGGLSLLLVRAARSLWPALSLTRRLGFGLVLSSFFGALLEVCQFFVAYRSADFLDWLADTLGALLAVLLCGLFLWLIPRRAHG